MFSHKSLRRLAAELALFASRPLLTTKQLDAQINASPEQRAFKKLWQDEQVLLREVRGILLLSGADRYKAVKKFYDSQVRRSGGQPFTMSWSRLGAGGGIEIDFALPNRGQPQPSPEWLTRLEAKPPKGNAPSFDQRMPQFFDKAAQYAATLAELERRDCGITIRHGDCKLNTLGAVYKKKFGRRLDRSIEQTCDRFYPTWHGRGRPKRFCSHEHDTAFNNALRNRRKGDRR